MARERNATPSRKIEPTIPADAYACLQRLADMGRYGANPTEVARYLLIRALDDLTRAGVLSAAPQSRK
jgi:hypothetical protein